MMCDIITGINIDTVASTDAMYLDSNNKTTKSEHEGVVAIIFHTTARHVAYLPVCTIKP